VAKRKSRPLSELMAQCDPNAPVPRALLDWEQMTPVGMEQVVFDGQADIRQAALVFLEKLGGRFEVTQLILFGSRARGDYHAESDADVALILRGSPGDFLETKLSMAGIAFDVLLETDVLIQALPVWESEWEEPARYSSPTLLQNIARDGIILWSA